MDNGDNKVIRAGIAVSAGKDNFIVIIITVTILKDDPIETDTSGSSENNMVHNH